MSRNLSLAALLAIYNQTSDVAIIPLLTITHPDLPPEDTLYFALNEENVVSREITFLAFPFDISVPDYSMDRPPQADLTISNIDRRMTEFLEISPIPATILIEIVLSSDWDTVEADWGGLTLRNVKYNVNNIQGSLTYEKMANEGYPKGVFCPSYFPGMF